MRQAQPSPQLGEGRTQKVQHAAHRADRSRPRAPAGAGVNALAPNQGYEPPRLTLPPVAATRPSRGSSARVKRSSHPGGSNTGAWRWTLRVHRITPLSSCRRSALRAEQTDLERANPVGATTALAVLLSGLWSPFSLLSDVSRGTYSRG